MTHAYSTAYMRTAYYKCYRDIHGRKLLLGCDWANFFDRAKLKIFRAGP